CHPQSSPAEGPRAADLPVAMTTVASRESPEGPPSGEAPGRQHRKSRVKPATGRGGRGAGLRDPPVARSEPRRDANEQRKDQVRAVVVPTSWATGRRRSTSKMVKAAGRQLSYERGR